MPSKNPEILKYHRDKWYKENKDKQIARQKIRRAELKAWLRSYRETLFCADCGISFKGRPEICDFHHLDPTTKDKTLANLICYSKEKAISEIKKCVPVCANCHRTRHKDSL